MSSTNVLSDAERAALWPAVTDDLPLSEELATLELEFRRREALRTVSTFVTGLFGGVLLAVLVFTAWIYWAT